MYSKISKSSTLLLFSIHSILDSTILDLFFVNNCATTIINNIVTVSKIMANYLFIRHGETNSNKIRKIMGHSKVPINSRGRSQAIQCGKYLANNYKNITAIYCSDLLRARETIDLIAKEINFHFPKEIIYKSELAEKSFGELEGLPVKEVYKMLENEKGEFDLKKRPLNGESDLDFSIRVRKGLADVVQENNTRSNDETVIILTHGGALQHILGFFVYPKDNKEERFPFNAKNCSLTSITTNENFKNKFIINFVNFYHYLKD